jgi:hypothetical protein
MRFGSTINTHDAHPATTRAPFPGRAITVALAAGVTVALALSIPASMNADEDGRRRECSNATLQGDYGILVSGIRGAGPGRTESFVGTAIHTYDGNGGFTGIDNSHGQLTGAVRDRQVTGTYEVNADCTGTATLIIPGVPFPIETTFVIVDRGREVEEVVMSPQPNLVTAVQHRIR